MIYTENVTVWLKDAILEERYEWHLKDALYTKVYTANYLFSSDGCYMFSSSHTEKGVKSLNPT